MDILMKYLHFLLFLISHNKLLWRVYDNKKLFKNCDWEILIDSVFFLTVHESELGEIMAVLSTIMCGHRRNLICIFDMSELYNFT